MKDKKRKYIRFLCEALFKEFEEEKEDLRHLVVDIYEDDDGFIEIQVDGDSDGE